MRWIAKTLILAAALLILGAAGAVAQSQARNRVLGFTTYDEDYFYVAAIVHKPVVKGEQAAAFADLLAQPLTDDVLAVFLQAPGESGKTPNRIEMVVGAAGGAQLYRGPTAAPLKGFEDFLSAGPEGPKMPFKYGVSKLSDKNMADGGSTGYVVEMAIPWVELGGRPKVGQRLRFNVVSYSAAPGTSPLLSLSPAVKTPQDALNPAKWGEVILVDSPVKSVASVPDAKVSARVFAAKPTIDGVVTDGEWNSLTSFGFEEAAGGGTAPTPPATGLPRFKPNVKLSKARPVVAATPLSARTIAKRTPQPVPRLVFTLYNYEFQADPRKAAPLVPVRSEDNASLLRTHPMNGAGPWMTYDRVDWHREQLENLRRAGIDVILPVYRAGAADKQRYATRGLMTLTSALQWMRVTKQDYPLIGLYLDTASLAEGEKPNLRSTAGKARLYAAIKDFFLMIPPAFRAGVPLSEQNGGGSANLVVLSSAAPFADLDSSFVDYCRQRFAADFGADLLVLGGSDFKPKAALDGYVSDTRGRGFQMDPSGWIKPASLGVSRDAAVKTAKTTTVASRDEGEIYRSQWKQAVDKKADWVFVDGWNDFREGTEIAPSLEEGIRNVDLTRAYSRAFAGMEPRRAIFLNDSIPGTAAPGVKLSASVRVSNGGATVWTADSFGLSCRWQKSGGGGAAAIVPLPSDVRPGEALTVPLTLSAPNEPGVYTLAVDVAELGKKDEVKTPFGAPLIAKVRVAAGNEANAPAYGISLSDSDLPMTLESGGTYTATVTLRNDGAKTWKTADGGRIIARVLRYTSGINGDGEQEGSEVADMADASVELPHDVAPGQEVTVVLPVTFSQADGQRLEPWPQTGDWIYQIRWEYAAGPSGTQGAVSAPQALALVDADFGPRFTTDVTPRQLPGDRRIPVPLSVRNDGPQTWRKNSVSIGYHWYYLDGTEVVWQDETTPIPQDVPPGGEVKDLLTWVTAPPNDGTYWLVWDVKVGDSWTSTLPSVRPFETRVQQIEVIRGRLTFVDLDKQYNLDGISSEADRTDGNFDGSGRTLPAELVPPLVTSPVVPSTIWLPAKASGLDSPRKISFRWGPKGDKEKNVVQCIGQRVPLVESRKAEVCKVVHLLAAATQPDVTAGFTLVFTDGTEQFTSFPFSRWDAAPAFGEELAFSCSHTHTPSGDAADKPVHLYHYTIRIAEQKKLSAVVLPNAPAVKILAITLEK